MAAHAFPVLHAVDGATLTEAADRLENAAQAFHGFMSLINHGENLNGAELYCLLAPLESEIDAARDCLRVARGRY